LSSINLFIKQIIKLFVCTKATSLSLKEESEMKLNYEKEEKRDRNTKGRGLFELCTN